MIWPYLAFACSAAAFALVWRLCAVGRRGDGLIIDGVDYGDWPHVPRDSAWQPEGMARHDGAPAGGAGGGSDGVGADGGVCLSHRGDDV